MGDGAPCGRDSVAPTLNCKDFAVSRTLDAPQQSQQLK